jgi:hypothetical protein
VVLKTPTHSRVRLRRFTRTLLSGGADARRRPAQDADNRLSWSGAGGTNNSGRSRSPLPLRQALVYTAAMAEPATFVIIMIVLAAVVAWQIVKSLR